MPDTPDRRITIRLKPEEYARLQAKAGSKPMARYILEALLNGEASKRRGADRRVLPKTALAARALALLGSQPRIVAFKDAAQRIKECLEPADDETKALLSETRDWLAKLHGLLVAALKVTPR